MSEFQVPPLSEAYCSLDEQEHAPNHEHFWSILEKLLTDIDAIKTRLQALEQKK